MRVCGLDPGSVKTGYGVIKAEGELLSYVECGVISAPASADKYQRLCVIGDDLQRMLVELKPDAIALEKGFVSVQRGHLQQGALVSAAARGVAGFVCTRLGIPIFEYANNTVKKAAAGHGRAKKDQVAMMVQAVLCLHRAPAPDAADALALSICHARQVVTDIRARAA